MPVSELYVRVGSMEIVEWIAHMQMTAREEREAMDSARNAPPTTMGG